MRRRRIPTKAFPALGQHQTASREGLRFISLAVRAEVEVQEPTAFVLKMGFVEDERAFTIHASPPPLVRKET